MPAEFVNPYQFVPIPDQVIRRSPLGHAYDATVAKERFCGFFDVHWLLRTPMAVPVDEWGTLTDGVAIPGSAVKGAVRSVHEAMFAGCLRVVDLNFRPVYRQAATSGVHDPKDWQLAIVTHVGLDDNKDESVSMWVCKADTRHVDVHDLKALKEAGPGGLPRTGDLVRGTHHDNDRGDVLIPTGIRSGWDPTSTVGGREYYSQCAPGDRVVLVTATAARNQVHDWYWATASVRDGRERQCTRAALKAYGRLIAGARKSRGNGDWQVVSHTMKEPGSEEPLGERRAVREKLEPGDVVWVKVDHDRITHIKRSQLWREQKDVPSLGQRTPRSAHPCSHLDVGSGGGLCLSCTIFGSSDAKAEADRGDQNSYSGHVRFGRAIVHQAGDHCTPGETTNLAGEEVWLNDLGQPHPGAGMFYLTDRREWSEPSHKHHRKTRWDADSDDERKVRGRKFYFHSEPAAQRNWIAQQGVAEAKERFRGEKSDHTKRALILNQGQVVVQRIHFDGLDATALSTLIAAIQPHRWLGGKANQYALHLGGGKPFGLGSVTASLHDIKVWTVANRYANGKPGDLPALEKQDVLDRCGAIESLHEPLRKMLRLNGLDENERNRVSYPTLEPWSKYGDDDFGNSYEYFDKYGGKAGGTTNNPEWRGAWHPLPGAGANQIMRGQR